MYDVIEIVHLRLSNPQRFEGRICLRLQMEKGEEEPTLVGHLEIVYITFLLQHYCMAPLCFQVPGGLLSLFKAHIRGGQLDGLQEPHCRSQRRQHTCMNYSSSNFIASHFSSFSYSSLVSVTCLGALENLLRPYSRLISCVCKAREYYIFTGNVRESHQRLARANPLECG